MIELETHFQHCCHYDEPSLVFAIIMKKKNIKNNQKMHFKCNFHRVTEKYSFTCKGHFFFNLLLENVLLNHRNCSLWICINLVNYTLGLELWQPANNGNQVNVIAPGICLKKSLHPPAFNVSFKLVNEFQIVANFHSIKIDCSQNRCYSNAIVRPVFTALTNLAV